MIESQRILYEFADIYMKLNKEKTQYMPKILHLKKEFLYYYDYLPNDWIRNKFDFLIAPPTFGIHLSNIISINLKIEEKQYFIVFVLRNSAVINFSKVIFKINPLLAYKKTEDYIKNFKEKEEYKDDIIFKGKEVEWIFKSVKSNNHEDFLQPFNNCCKILDINIPHNYDLGDIYWTLKFSKRKKHPTFGEPVKNRNYAIIVDKLNDSRLKYNKRILHVSQECLIYYEKIPKNWKDNEIEMLNIPPKAGVKLADIDKFLEMDGKLMIEFKSDKLLKFPQQNFIRSKRKNPLFLSPFKPELFYIKYPSKLEKIVWLFKNETSAMQNLVSKLAENKNLLKDAENLSFTFNEKNRLTMIPSEEMKNEAKKENIIESIVIKDSNLENKDNLQEIIKKSNSIDLKKDTEKYSTLKSDSLVQSEKLASSEVNALISNKTKPYNKMSIFHPNFDSKNFSDSESANLIPSPHKTHILSPNSKESDSLKRKEKMLNGVEVSFNLLDNELKKNSGELEFASRRHQKSILKKKTRFTSKEISIVTSQISIAEGETESEVDFITTPKGGNSSGTQDQQRNLRDDADILLKKIVFDEEGKSHNGDNHGSISKISKMSTRNIIQKLDMFELNLSSTNWETKYQMLLNECLNSNNNFELSLKVSMYLMHFIGEYVKYAKNIVKEIIDDMFLKTNLYYLTKYKGFNQSKYENYYTYEDERNKTSIKISWSEFKQNFRHEEKFYEEEQLKLLGKEFNSLELLTNVVYYLKKNKNIANFLLPLSCMISYKGAIALVICNPPINPPHTLIIGALSDDIFKTNSNLNSSLCLIARHLNIKEHSFIWDKRLLPFPIYLSVFTQIHQSVEYEENENLSLTDFESLGTQKKMDSSLISISETPTDKYSRKGIPYYLTKLADILPPDVVEESQSKEYHRKLRPEFFLKYKIPLNPDVFLLSDTISQKMSQDNAEVMHASIYLQNEYLGEFLKKLEEKEYFPLDCYSLREIFHTQGINMRYLGKIAKYTILPHIKQICMADMIARKIKTIFRYYIAEFISNKNERKGSEIIITPTLRKGSSSITEGQSNHQNQTDFPEFVIDFLNLIFGKGRDTEIFWQEILKPQVYLHFDYELPHRKSLSPGLLLNFICFHCQFLMNFDDNINFFENISLFQIKNFIGFKYSIKIYKLKYLEINQIIINNLNDNDSDFNEKCLKIQEAEEIAAKTEDNYFIFNVKIKLIEIFLKKSQREAALAEIEETLSIFHNLHPLQIKLYIQVIKSAFLEDRIDKAKCFLKKCETTINFNFQTYHPIFIIIYDLFGEYNYDKNEIGKAKKYYEKSLNQSLKIFGINHMQTAESLLKTAKMKIKLNEFTEGLEDFIKAFNIIYALKGENSAVTSSTAYKISHLLFNNGRVSNSIHYAKISEKFLLKAEFSNFNALIHIDLLICEATEYENNYILCFSYLDKTWQIVEKYTSKNLEYYYKLYSIVLSLIIKQLNNKERNSLNKQFQKILDVLENDQKIEDVIYNEDLNSKKEMIERIKEEIRKDNSLPEYFIQMMSMIQNPTESSYLNKMNASKKKSLASKSSFAIPESVGNMLGSIVLATETDPHKRFKIEKYKKDSFLKRSMDVYPHDPKKGSFPALKINSVILDEPEKGDESYMITKVDKDEGLLMPLLMPEDQLKSKALLEERQSKKVDIKEIPIAKDNFGLGDKPWHLYGAKELLEELESDLKTGLSSEEHAIRLDKYGPNLITPAKQMHWIIKLILNMVGGFQLFLWAGGILCLIVFFITSETDYQTLALGLLCFIVVILTSLFQSYQEGKSDEVMAALRALTPQTVFVIRNGLLMEVQADSLVPGDICNVKAGEKVPADLRILKSSDLKVNNASLTGENVDIKLGSEAHSESLYEAKNIARMGCNFTAGTGIAVVFSTGDNTFFGTIAKSTTTIKRPDSCLKKEIKRLVHIMGAVAITIGVIFLILALKFGYSTIEAIVFMIGIIVANVPEGLLPQLTVALTLTAQRMQKKGVVVSNLDIIETLGATTVICSDKTGTLTCNRMTVSHVVYDRKIHKTPESPDMGAEFMEFFEPNDEHFKTLQRIATLNTDAEFLTHETDVLKRMTKGDASESALIKFLQPIRDIIDIRRECPRVFGIPFNSTNKWMCSIHDIKKQSGSNNLLLMVKGAPEKIISMCEKIYRDGQIQNLTPEGKSELEKINDTLAKHGERVLAFADSVLDEHFNKEFPFEQEPVNFPMNNLVFAGFFSLIDPPRPTVKHAIEDCHTAGIKVFMVTGDHPTTAQAIAKSLNLITQPTEKDLIQMKEPIPIEGCHSIVITGSELLTFTEQDWDRVLKHQEIVFARTMPQQKQDIVRELNKLGHIVAMTGDGVNDAPALKAAHIGIAMGSGAAVAKEAGQLVLLEDDFGSIVEGIREGRLIFENLKKTICYVLSSNIPELIPFLLFIAMRIPLSIETIMIILIDVGTDLAPAVALAYEEPEDLIMSIPPRTKDNHLVGIKLMLISYVFWGVILTFGSYWSFFYVFYDHGFTVSSLIGAGANIRDSWSSLADDRKNFFKDLCENNTWVKQNNVNDRCNDNVMGSFMDDLVDTLAVAQSAYFMAIVWGQLAAIFIRKTQMASLFTWYRLTCNKAIYVAIVIELAILFIVVYIPGLNHALMYTSVSSKWSVTALWVIPVIIILDEFRKFICRLNPKGKFAKYTTL